MGILLGYKKKLPTYLPYFSVARYANTIFFWCLTSFMDLLISCMEWSLFFISSRSAVMTPSSCSRRDSASCSALWWSAWTFCRCLCLLSITWREERRKRKFVISWYFNLCLLILHINIRNSYCAVPININISNSTLQHHLHIMYVHNILKYMNIKKNLKTIN